MVAQTIQASAGLFLPKAELRDIMLVYQFLHTLEVEWSLLLPDSAGGLSGDEFAEFSALKDITYLSIINSVHAYVKYSAEELYNQDSLSKLIWYLSEVLCVANVIEPTLGARIWRQAADTATNAYFYYYMAKHEENFEKSASSSKGNDFLI